MEKSCVVVVALLLLLELSSFSSSAQVEFVPASQLDERAFLRFYTGLEVSFAALPGLAGIRLTAVVQSINSSDWVTDVTELALNSIYEELEASLGSEVVELAANLDVPAAELERRIPISGNRWVDVAAVRKFLALIRGAERGRFLSFEATTTDSQARVVAVFDQDVGLPHFLLK